MISLHLDLEETVIDSWESMTILPSKINAIASLAKSLQISEFSVFSFAVWNAQDQAEFARYLQPILERMLRMECIGCPTVDDIMEADRRQTNVRFDEGELGEWIAVRGKADAFRNFILQRGTVGTHILVDDVVPDSVLYMSKSSIAVVLKNIDTVVSDFRS